MKEEFVRWVRRPLTEIRDFQRFKESVITERIVVRRRENRPPNSALQLHVVGSLHSMDVTLGAVDFEQFCAVSGQPLQPQNSRHQVRLQKPALILACVVLLVLVAQSF